MAITVNAYHLLCVFRNVLDERDRIYGQLSEYLQLKSTIEQIQVGNVSSCDYVS
jgi:hypothetical protein